MAPRRIDAAVLADLFSRAADLRAGRAEGSESPRPERSRALIEELFARARALRDASDEGPALDAGAPADGAVGVDGAATDPPTELSVRPPPPRPPRLDHGKAVEEFRRTLESLFEGSGEGDLEALASASGVLDVPEVAPTLSAPPRPGPLPTRERVFSAAAEAIFGDRLDELERLVMATFEARPGSIAARAAAATSTPPPSPELHAVEPGDPLLQPAPAKSPASWLAEAPPPAAEQPPRWMSQSSVDGLLGGFELPGAGSSPKPAPEPAAAVDPRITESAVDGVLAGFHFDGGDPIPAALAGPRLPPAKAPEPALDDPYAARAVEAAKSPPSSSGSWGGDSGTGSTVGFDPLRVYAKGAPAPPPAAPAVASALDLGASFEGFGWPAGATPTPPPARTAASTRLVIPVPSDVEDAPEPALRPTRPMGRSVPGASASATIGFDGVLPAGGPAYGSPTIGFDGVLPASGPARGSPTIGFDGVLPASGPARGSPTIGFDGVLPAGGPAYGSPTIGFDGVLPAGDAPGPGATIGFDGVLPGPARAPGGNASTTIGFEGVLPAPVAPGGPSSGKHRRPGFAQTVAFDDVLPPPVVAPPVPARSNAPWLLASGSVRAAPPPPPREDPGSTLGFDGVIGAPPFARPPEVRPGRPEVLTTNAAQSARGPRGAGPGPLADFLRALPPGADPLAPAAGPPAGRRPTPTAGLPAARPPAPDPFAPDPFAAPGGPARPGAPAVIGGPAPGAAWPTQAAGPWPQPQGAAWPPPGDPFAPRPAQGAAFVDPFRRDPAASDRPTVYPEEPTAWGQAAGGRPPAAPGPTLPPPARSGGSGAWAALPPGQPPPQQRPPGRSGGSGAYPTLGQPQQPPPARSGGSGAWLTLGQQQQQQPPRQPPPQAAPRPRPLPPGGKAPGAPGLRASGEGFDPTAPSWWDEGEEPPPA